MTLNEETGERDSASASATDSVSPPPPNKQVSARLLAHLKRLHADPVSRAKIRASKIGRPIRVTPKFASVLKALHEKSRGRPRTPAEAAHLKRINSDPERRAKIARSARGKRHRMTPRAIAAIEKRSRAYVFTPARRAHLLQAGAVARLDPEVQRRRVRCQNPSTEEITLRGLLSDNFLHTGQDATRTVAGKFPDFQDPVRRLVVEYDGHYTHYRTQRGQIRDDRRDATLAAVGYRVLHVYPWDLRDSEALRERIKEWANS
jgi:very-short-patch-repair endonuclease